MKTLQIRPDPDKKRNKWGDRVQVYVRGWRSNREFYTGRCFECGAGGMDNYEFIQLETVEDCQAVQSARPFDFHIAIGDVFRRCKGCGQYTQTFYGYHRPRKRGGLTPILAAAWP